MELGRGFVPADEAPSAPPVAIISHGLWERRFAEDPAVLGKTILLNSTPVTIVGVTALAFRGDMLGIGQDVWALLMHFRRPEDLRNRASRYEVFGLVLKQGMLTGLTGVAAGLVLSLRCDAADVQAALRSERDRSAHVTR